MWLASAACRVLFVCRGLAGRVRSREVARPRREFLHLFPRRTAPNSRRGHTPVYPPPPLPKASLSRSEPWGISPWPPILYPSTSRTIDYGLSGKTVDKAIERVVEKTTI